MRNFILGKTLAANNTTVDNLASGAVGFATLNDNGQLAIINSSEAILKNNKKGYVVLGRSAKLGGPVVLPFFANHFSFSIGEYQAATTFKATITIPEDIVAGEEYTVILVKKGVKFNERNKWTATLRAKDSDTATTIADKIVAYFMDNNVPRYGVTASNSNGTITFEGAEEGIGYTILGADALLGVSVNITKDEDGSPLGTPAYGDASYVKDLANKAAADAGFEYTYMDDVNYLYPDYPLNPLKNADAEDTGFSIVTIRFAEQREVKTVDDVVHQIVQIAFPSSVNLESLETLLTSFVGI